MTEESAVKVCVRVRPTVEREENASVAEDTPPVQLYWKADKKSIHQIDDGASTKSFSFDRVFGAEETTNQLYQAIAKPLVVSTVAGYNGTIFAYGQTSSGKTFTMMGSVGTPGVIPLAVEDVFQTINTFPKKEFLLRVSYMEIYNETVTDLLVDSWKRKPLEVRETINKNIYVADLTEELVTSPAQALAWIRKGEKNRHYGKTKMNQRSSRSHTIFRMILESRERSDPASGENADGAIIVSHLNLVDLAGSERASQTGAEGARFKEGCNINRSLFTLGQVIKKLTDEGQRGFTNYRDSKLTRILQNSLGGNAKTVIICTITPVALDETLSTLQFASTAKKMKNDPHVTEVSDDGALLKRYRNEIADLKRRLHELQVSPVMQPTETEKEVLSQLLQEKDQLQREQEDRIKNLTKLLVSGSNLIPANRVPKRRVTWGGKMHRLARASGCDGFQPDLSLAESFTRKRKADRSCLSILGEYDEDFDSQWEIPEEPSDDMEISQTYVTTRSFGDSPNQFISPDRMHELSGKVSNLEMLLEMEIQQKEQAVTKAETLDGRVAELELRLETEAQQRREAAQKMETAEQRATEIDLQLKAEAQQRQEAVEKVDMLEIRMADLEEQLEERTQTRNEADDQMRKDFEETLQMCLNVASEKEMVITERDYLKQELGVFMEQTERLEKEKAALSKELEERKEMEEFKSLEEEFSKEHETEMQHEISSLKKVVESSELKCLELQKKLETLSEELKKKSQLAGELQKMSGKDLVQEVATLQRSLDDAEGVSRDTKKDWAFLRSRNIDLEEMHVTLAANHDKMEAEVNGLRHQLELEKSRYKKMQSDLQRELNVAFEENTKLTSLLDGKVPKNLIDSVELERTVANLHKELAASRDAEGSFRAQLDQLASLQDLPEKVNDLKKQVSELTEELFAVQIQRDRLLSSQADSQEESQQLRDSLQASQQEILKLQEGVSAAGLRENNLSQRCGEATEQLDLLRSDLERSHAERNQLMASVEETHFSLGESERQRASLEEKLNEIQQLAKDLEEKLADSEVSRSTEEEISKELQEQLNQLSEELQCVRAEKDALLSEKVSSVESPAEEKEALLSTVTSLTAERDQLRMYLQENEQMVSHLNEELQCVRAEKDALLSEEEAASTLSSAQEMETLLSTVTAERDQLKMDMQENVELMIENQEELRAALERNRVHKEQIKHLEKQTSERDGLTNERCALQIEELQSQVKTLTEELESVRAERDGLLSERMADAQTEETEKLLSRVTSLSEERDQLQEILEGLSQEKNLLKAEVEEKMGMVAQTGLDQQQILNSGLQSHDEQISQLQQQIEQLNATLHAVIEQKSQLEADLQRNVEMATETRSLLQSLNEELQEQKQRNSELQKESESEQRTLTEELESVRAQRDGLLMEKANYPQTPTEETEKLMSQVASLSEEREQLQEMLEGLRQERMQLKAEHEERMEMMQGDLQQHGNSQQSLKEEQHLLQMQQLEERLESSKQEVSQLKSDLQENVDLMIENQEELRVAQEKIRVLKEEIDVLRSQKAELESQTSGGSDAENSVQIQELQNQIQCLTSDLERAKAERDDLQSEKASSRQTSEETEMLLSRVTSLSEERDQLQEILEGLRQEKNQQRAELEERMETLQTEITQLHSSLQTVTEQKSQLENDLQQNMEMASTAQRLLKAAQEELDEHKHAISDLENLSQERERSLNEQMSALTEKLQSVEAERDGLLSEKEASVQTSTEEKEMLLSRLTSLSDERDQLQGILEELRHEKNQQRAELEERMEVLQAEVAQLHNSLQIVTEQKSQLENNLQQNMDMASTTEGLLKAAQEELQEQRQMISDLEKLNEEKECSLDQQVKMLQEKLKGAEAERDGLLAEKEASLQTCTEETEKLLSRVTSLSEERDHLQEILEALRQEKNQLRAELEERMEMEKLNQQEELNSQQQADGGQQEEQLQQEIQHLKTELASVMEENIHLQRDLKDKMETVEQLEEELQTLRQSRTHAKAEAEASQQLLSEANTTISVLREQLSSLDQSSDANKEAKSIELSSRLQDSTQKLQESFGKFQDFMGMCSQYNVEALKKTFGPGSSPTSLPSPNISMYSAVCKLQLQTVLSMGHIVEHLQKGAQGYRNLFEELVKKDLAVFEERRLQDVLLCRAQAPSFSVKVEDFQNLWEHRLSELLDKRQLYLQNMDSILEKLRADMTSFPGHLSVEITERERLKEQLHAAYASEPVDLKEVDSIMSYELNRRSALANSREMTLQGIRAEHSRLSEELRLLELQTDSQLMEERSKSATLLQTLEGAPLKTELDLLKDNQQLVLQLQQSEEKFKALHVQIGQLEEAQTKANSRVSNHKQATQLLQTELEDTRAQVKEGESAIQSLKNKLRQSESAAQMETLQAKVFKMEVELTSASSAHQQQIHRLNTLLSEKEEAVRKLKETLRKSQQQGEESFLQGEDLHARLTHPRGLVIKSSILLEKNKLEEEVKQLHAKLNELESSVSSQQAEIAKWKSRALKLKGRNKGEVDKPLSPCTPTKRGLPMMSDPYSIHSSPKRFLGTPRKMLDSPRKMLDSPKKLLDSPKVTLPGSPKSRFFGAGSEMFSMNCPKQFFDNSSLGMIPDAGSGADKKEWWPDSPKQEDLCRTQ